MLPERGKRPGWLSIAANGGGGYWFDVMTDFPEAVATTHEALEDLSARLEAGDAFQETLEAVQKRVNGVLDGVGAALSARRSPPDGPKSGRRRKRRRIKQ